MDKSISIFEASTLNTIAQTPRAHSDVRERLVASLDTDSEARAIGQALLKKRTERDAEDEVDRMANELEEWVGVEDQAAYAEG